MSSLTAGDRMRRHRRARTLLGAMLAAPAAMVQRIRRWRERRRAWHLLAAMSERQLQDIGVCRSDIAYHAMHDKGQTTPGL